MYENIMDYTQDACHFMFTEEQVLRMRAVLSGSGCRKELYYQGAQLESNWTLQPSSQRSDVPSAFYHCSDTDCPIFEEQLNDGSCDCENCEDEDYYNCTSCAGGCPTECLSSSYCTTSSVFVCNDNCTINSAFYDDYW